MKKKVSVLPYEKAGDSVRRAVESCGGLDAMPSRARVFIKPNIVYWTRAAAFPKWGVITTSRVVEDIVILLKEKGINDIIIGEGSVTMNPKDRESQKHAYETMGYGLLEKRYGVRAVNIFDRPFQKRDLGDGITLRFNSDILESDFAVNLPVLKTHAQTIVSLGIKNLKGVIDIPSRKKCHNADPEKDLHYHVARLADRMPPMLTLIDGIFCNERGPAFDGRIRRSNLLLASGDVLAADMVGARILGYAPSDIPHLRYAAQNRGRCADLSDIEIIGEQPEDVAMSLQYAFPYNQEKTLPLPMEKMGIRGLAYRPYDLSICTYCSGMNGLILSAIALAWKGKAFDNVEVLTGKIMKASPGMKKTILLGKCMYKKNKDNPDIREMIAVKECPPRPESVIAAFHKAGIGIDPEIIRNMESMPVFFMERYKGREEFTEDFFRIE